MGPSAADAKPCKATEEASSACLHDNSCVQDEKPGSQHWGIDRGSVSVCHVFFHGKNKSRRFMEKVEPGQDVGD
jgi:hypothetical protein